MAREIRNADHREAAQAVDLIARIDQHVMLIRDCVEQVRPVLERIGGEFYAIADELDRRFGHVDNVHDVVGWDQLTEELRFLYDLIPE